MKEKSFLTEEEFVNSLTINQRKFFHKLITGLKKERDIELERATHYRERWQEEKSYVW